MIEIDGDTLVCTLLADGSSDRVLVPILRWLLDQYCPFANEIQFVENLPSNPGSLVERIKAAIDYYPCHLLFLHRDAEGEPLAARQAEIDSAWGECGLDLELVSVVPVRMTEAWLLVDESAIRCAAGNRNGRVAIELPRVNRLEQIRDPKSELFDLLRVASEWSPSRLRSFRPEARRHRVTELMSDESFALLRQLQSFRVLEDQFKQIFTE